MSRKSAVAGRHYLLTRKDPRTGFQENLVYEGPLRQKPQGWTLARPL